MKKSFQAVFLIVALGLVLLSTHTANGFAAGSTAANTANSTTSTSLTYLPCVLNPCANDIPIQHSANEAFEQEVFAIINTQRAANGGLARVQWNDALSQIARFHSIDMFNNDFMSHTGSAGESPWDRYEWLCEDFGMKGEIIAWGYRSPAAVMQAWMNSAGHRNIILTAGFNAAGGGFADGNYWTFNFGSRAASSTQALHWAERTTCTQETELTPEGGISFTLCE